MNETSTLQTITFKDIWELFLQRLIIILLVTVLTVAIVYVYNRATYRPMYQSTATLYIAGEDAYSHSSSADAYNNYALTLKVVSDCNYLLASRSVVDQVIQEMDLNMTFNVLQSRIATNNPTNTRILEVTVEAETPKLAKQIVDRLCEIGEDKINDAMGANHVKLYEYGTLSGFPCNKIPGATYLIIGATAAILTFALFLLIFLLDDRLRSAEQIEQVLGLSVLGDIPDYNATHHKKSYGYYNRRGAYGVYASSAPTSQKKGKA